MTRRRRLQRARACLLLALVVTQARQFSRLEPTTHGHRQRDFETVYDALYELHLRVVDYGRPVGGDG